ncbi:UPF0223 family protein [Weissella diestrammenae]|uniref:UPF0223 family protein n=1 Tax=Weissella diestrammenae TaxID=1162633 RepID=A0A7G9T5F0_9LACO|nr:UPF0223 family protein [Weissella diestrammenae]MCM0583184.1 UPF0223 family protein [Weissella diestrammenae]QNN75325.1 UPF0223 family protein [Weissella diestrammenae]
MIRDANFNYPMLPGWQTADIVIVSALYSAVSKAYEGGIDRDELLSAYRAFKTVVTQKSEEKQLGRQFEAESHYSIYAVMQVAKKSQQRRVRMGDA